MPKRIMIQCKARIKKDAVRRETIDGVEHIIVSSSTLPDDIVMNRGLYPAEEIEKSFLSLERTFAPLEHPTINGEFISASDPEAVHGFHAGAYNVNVRREGGRVHIDKKINVQEALKTEKGKRLLDRIDELENNSDPRPIHSSVAAFLDPEFLDKPKTNSDGQEFDWIAKNMVFDHDAILLDSSGAAQPSQGVGIAVNKDGQQFQINNFDLDANQDQSVGDLRNAVSEALEKSAFKSDWIAELFSDHVIFESGENLFDVPFVVDENGIVTVVGIPLPVERNVTFTPKTNHQKGDKMKEMITNALKSAGIETEGLTDAELMEAHAKISVNEPDDTATIVANAITEALKPISEKVDSLQASQDSTGAAEAERLADVVVNSGKYKGMDLETAKALPIEKLKEFAANCGASYGVSPVFNSDDADKFGAVTEMLA